MGKVYEQVIIINNPLSAFEKKILVTNNKKLLSLISLIGNFDHFSTKRIKILGNEECSQNSVSIHEPLLGP